MLTMSNFVVIQNHWEIKDLKQYLIEGGLVVVEMANKQFSTRIIDGQKTLRATPKLRTDETDFSEIFLPEHGHHRFARLKTQITAKDGRVLKFEGYYLEFYMTSTDLRNEILKQIPNI